MITQSSFTVDHEQTDGSRWVTETHELDNGGARVFMYKAPKGLDPAAVMAERAAAMNAELSDG